MALPRRRRLHWQWMDACFWVFGGVVRTDGVVDLKCRRLNVASGGVQCSRIRLTAMETCRLWCCELPWLKDITGC